MAYIVMAYIVVASTTRPVADPLSAFADAAPLIFFYFFFTRRVRAVGLADVEHADPHDLLRVYIWHHRHRHLHRQEARGLVPDLAQHERPEREQG